LQHLLVGVQVLYCDSGTEGKKFEKHSVTESTFVVCIVQCDKYSLPLARAGVAGDLLQLSGYA
jgi:hypothetical protein